MSSIDFLDLTVDMSQIFLLCTEEFLRFLRHESDQSHRNRKNNQSDQCHERRNAQHHDQYTEQRCNGSNNGRNTLVQSLS